VRNHFLNILEIILGEITIIAVLSFTISTCLALLFTYSYTLSIYEFPYMITCAFVEFPQDYIMVIPKSLPVTISIFLASLLLSVIIPTILLYRKDLSRALRVSI